MCSKDAFEECVTDLIANLQRSQGDEELILDVDVALGLADDIYVCFVYTALPRVSVHEPARPVTHRPHYLHMHFIALEHRFYLQSTNLQKIIHTNSGYCSYTSF